MCGEVYKLSVAQIKGAALATFYVSKYNLKCIGYNWVVLNIY